MHQKLFNLPKSATAATLLLLLSLAAHAGAPSSVELLLQGRSARKLAQDHAVRQAALILASESTQAADGYPLPFVAGFGAGPSGGGRIPSGSLAPKTDSYGSVLGYCAWDNGPVTNGAGLLPGALDIAAPTLSVIGSGPDNVFSTTCAQVFSGSGTQGDDYVATYSAGQILAGVQGSSYFSDAVSATSDLSLLSPTSLKDGQTRLVRSNNALYRYQSATGTWIPVSGDWNALINKPTTVSASGLTDAVSTSRQVIAGSGLVGGGDLSSDRTFALDSSGVSAGTYGSATSVPAISVDALGRVTSATNAAIAFPVTSVFGRTGNVVLGGADISGALGYVPANQSRSIAAGTGLIGGGDLSSDRILSLSNTGVTSGTYGSATAIPQFTVDAQGRLTTSGTVNVNITGALGYTPVNLAGDTMTGQLSLPTDGLVIGVNQVVATGGNLGVGTAAPGAKLDVVSTGSDVQSRVYANNTTGAAILNLTAGNGVSSSRYAYTRFLNSESSPQEWRLGTYGTPQFTLYDQTAGVARLTVDTGGSVLRGTTTSPFGGDQAGYVNSNGTQVGYWGVSASYGGTFLGSYSNHKLGFITNNATRMVLDSNGNVGIGTATPGKPLDVVGNATDAVSVRIRGRSSDNIGNIEFTSNDGATQYGVIQGRAGSEMRIVSNGSSAITSYTNGLERMRIDASGNVGIGTSSPAYKLDVASTMQIRGASNGIYFNGTPQYISTDSAGTALAFGTNSAERMRIDSGGRVGIAVTPFASTGANGSNLQIGDPTSAGGTGITIGSTSTSDIQFARATSGVNQYAGLIRYSHTGDYMSLWTASTERARIDANGNLGVGTIPNSNYRIHASSTGSNQVASQGTTDASFITNLGGTQALYLHSTATMSEINELRALPLLLTVNGAERMRVDSTGNVGIGVTPNSWVASSRVLQIGAGALVRGSTNNKTLEIGANYYADTGGANRYIGTGEAAAYEINSGAHTWYSAAAGVAGGAASFSTQMKLTAQGQLQLNTALQDGVTAYFKNTSSTGYGMRIDGGATFRYALSVRNYAGTELMQVDGYGNVGIGGIPNQKLDLQDPADVAAQVRTTGTANSAALTLSSGDGTTSGLYSYVRFFNNDTNGQQWRVGTYGSNNFTIRDHLAGTTRMVIDTSGSVGIGTAIPTTGAKLDLRGMLFQNAITTGAASNQHVFNINGPNYAAFYDAGLNSTNGGLAIGGTLIPSTVPSSATMFMNVNQNSVGINTTSPTQRLTVQASSGTTGFDGVLIHNGNTTQKVMLGITGSTYSYAGVGANQAWLYAGSNDLNIGPDGLSNSIKFTTNAAERMRIDSSGNVGIGRTASGYMLDVNGLIRTTGAVTTTSDARFKHNIANIPSDSILARFMAVDPVTYNLNYSGAKNYGYIAQQLEPLFPEMVIKDNDGFYGVQYTQMIPVIHAVVQDHQHALETIGQRLVITKDGSTSIHGFGDTAFDVRNGSNSVLASFKANGTLALPGQIDLTAPDGKISFSAAQVDVTGDATTGDLVVNGRQTRTVIRLQGAGSNSVSKIFGYLFGDENGIGLSDGEGKVLLSALTRSGKSTVSVNGDLTVGNGESGRMQIGSASIHSDTDGFLNLEARSGIRVFDPATQKATITMKTNGDIKSDGSITAKTFIPTEVKQAYDACSSQVGAVARDESGQLLVCTH